MYNYKLVTFIYINDIIYIADASPKKMDRYKNIYTENSSVCECEHHSLNNNSVSNLQLDIECHIFTVVCF